MSLNNVTDITTSLPLLFRPLSYNLALLGGNINGAVVCFLNWTVVFGSRSALPEKGSQNGRCSVPAQVNDTSMIVSGFWALWILRKFPE